MSSRAEEKAQRRAEREAAQAAAGQAARRRRLLQLGGLVVAAVAVVAVAIAVSSGGGDGGAKGGAGGKPTGAADVAAMFAGVPQQGQALGRASAPVTLVEFADLKCPICREFSAQALPDLVQRYVRTGKLRIVFEPQTFVGSPPGNSEPAARFALAAGAQNRLWPFVELFYANQQDESTGYVTDDFLRQIASGVSGLDAAKALAARDSAPVGSALRSASARFTAAGFTGTPSFLLGKTGSPGRPLQVSSFDPSQFAGPIDALLKP